jgi:hypothetical protein
VNPLVGELGYISKAAKEVGVVLHPTPAGALFAEFECGEGADYIQVGAGPDSWTDQYGTATEEPWYSGGGGDGIISPVTPVDRMSSTETQEYKVTTTETEPEKGVHFTIPANGVSHFEGGPAELLESWDGNTTETGEFLKPGPKRFAWGPSAEEVTNVNKGHGEIEIKA